MKKCKKKTAMGQDHLLVFLRTFINTAVSARVLYLVVHNHGRNRVGERYNMLLLCCPNDSHCGETGRQAPLFTEHLPLAAPDLRSQHHSIRGWDLAITCVTTRVSTTTTMQRCPPLLLLSKSTAELLLLVRSKLDALYFLQTGRMRIHHM